MQIRFQDSGWHFHQTTINYQITLWNNLMFLYYTFKPFPLSKFIANMLLYIWDFLVIQPGALLEVLEPLSAQTIQLCSKSFQGPGPLGALGIVLASPLLTVPLLTAYPVTSLLHTNIIEGETQLAANSDKMESERDNCLCNERCITSCRSCPMLPVGFTTELPLVSNDWESDRN